ncbi:hypothetical protein HanIR_Chr03g0126571 [Helianthus annuus]|nr:hypothetical protein HanIR_Chr03g0126571 [Helianthus annuus]
MSIMTHLKFKKNISVLQDSPVPLSYCISLLPELASSFLELNIPLLDDLY